MPPARRTIVVGPAYLDRILRVDAPLADPPLDRSVTGRVEFGDPGDIDGLRVVGLPEGNLAIALPPNWPGPKGTIRVGTGSRGESRDVRGIGWSDDLGGMGAGYAKALGGTLHHRLGDRHDPVSRRVVELLAREGLEHRPSHVPGRPADWTLLITSGPHGDKLPIGLRAPEPDSARVIDPPPELEPEPVDLLVVASMTNRRAAAALATIPARVRLFAPSLRNMGDVDPKVSSFAGKIDVFCCNRAEWEALADREEVAWRVSILVVTDGPRGAVVRYTTPTGDAGRIVLPPFPRSSPPRDTNRAGEAFASTLITTLLDAGWEPGVTDPDLASRAATRASAASALVLDRDDFGFPSPAEIDRAIAAGVV